MTFKIGDRVKILPMAEVHDYYKGGKFTVDSISFGAKYDWLIREVGGTMRSLDVYEYEIEHITSPVRPADDSAAGTLTVDDLAKQQALVAVLTEVHESLDYDDIDHELFSNTGLRSLPWKGEYEAFPAVTKLQLLTEKRQEAETFARLVIESYQAGVLREEA